MLHEFMNDRKEYSLHTAWYNLRWNVAWSVAKFLIRRPLHLEVRDH